MEIRDLYDGDKVKTGETIEKGQPIPKGKYYLTVAVFIQNFKGDFLLQHRSPEKGGKWATTGGHPKSGESSIEGISAEIKEELGVSINADNLKLFKTIKTNNDFVDLYYLNTNINIDDIIIQQEEVQDVKWANISEIEKLIQKKYFLDSHIEFFSFCLEYLKKPN